MAWTAQGIFVIRSTFALLTANHPALTASLQNSRLEFFTDALSNITIIPSLDVLFCLRQFVEEISNATTLIQFRLSEYLDLLELRRF